MAILPQTEPLEYLDEPYSSAASTERLAFRPSYLPDDARPITIALIFIAAGAFRLGQLAAPLWDQRGWAALLVFAVVVAAVIIRSRQEH